MLDKTMETSLDWPEIFKEWESSGQNQRVFCAERGYPYNRFKDARVKHGYTRADFLRKKSSRGLRPEAPSTIGSFFAVSIDKKSAEEPTAVARSVEKSEIELKLPFGVVLTFRGVEG